jgi:predicted dehydrogenase
MLASSGPGQAPSAEAPPGRSKPSRRAFLQGTAGLAAATLAGAGRSADDLRPLRAAVIGLGRGLGHVKALLDTPAVDVAVLAEVDPGRLAVGQELVAGRQAAPCRGVADFRTALDDASLDAVFIALPNFWHTPATLLALEAGKHVYVEKPGSQNPHEAELIVAATRRHDRLVQMGNQRRTWMQDAINALHGGAIGRVRYGRGAYSGRRGPVVPHTPPPGFDLDLWQGPVPDDPVRDPATLVHYDWHWFWHWGNGELGNNGVHYLDVLRWGLGVEVPLRVTYTGGRYWHDDAQETPDTATATYDFGDVGCEWVHSSCRPRPAERAPAEIIFEGDEGTMAIFRNGSWKIFDAAGAEAGGGESRVAADDLSHVGNFIAAIRGTAALTSPIAEGQASAMLCHLGNIAYRTGTVVRCDPATGRIVDNPAAEQLWARPAYRAGWGMTA